MMKKALFTVLAALGLASVGVVGTASPAMAVSTPQWSVIPSPSPGSGDDYLGSVSCISTNFCVAVGSQESGVLIETWDGTSWSVAASPNLSLGDFLEGVSCTSTSFCVSVGVYYNQATSSDQTLVGTVSGTVPTHPHTFTYSVTATNSGGSATTGPFRVNLTHGKGHHHGKHRKGHHLRLEG
jgi:hypothetical protein